MAKTMKRLPLGIAIGAIILMTFYGLWFDLGRHAKINSGRFDLGNVEQVVWNVTQGHGFVETDPYGVAQVSRFAFHADPFLLTLVPFYAVWPHTETLLFLQVLAVASGGVAVWLISRRLLASPWWGVVFVMLYTINPAVHWSMSFDVHAVTFAIPLILWAVWTAMAKRWWVTLVLVVLAMLTKEQVGMSLGLLGLYVLFIQRQRRWGVVLTVLPVVWSLAMFLFVLPHYRPETVGSAEVYETVFGQGAAPILKAIATQPIHVVTELLSKQNIIYVWQLFVGSGLVGIGSPWSLAAIPDLLINGLSLKPSQHQLVAHYASSIVPWIIVGAMQATAWMIARSQQRRWGKYAPVTLGLWIIGFSLYGVWATSPLPFAKNDQRRFVTWSNVYAQPVKEWSTKIPATAVVSVTNNIGAHFSRRQQLFSFPLGVEQAQYVMVLEHHGPPVVATDAEVTEKISQLHDDPAWEKLYQQGELTILRRR